MYLSKLSLNRSRQATMWMARPYRVHQRLSMACGDVDCAGERLLFRIDENRGQTTILVQTRNPPDWAAAFGEFPVLEGSPLCKQVDPRPRKGQILSFRLRANPTRRKSYVAPEGDGKKRRIGITDELEQLAWLARKGEGAGFRVLRAQVRQDGLMKDTQTSEPQRRGLALLSVQFDGVLQVVDADRLSAALEAGIGSGKALGFGLLSLAPVRN